MTHNTHNNQRGQGQTRTLTYTHTHTHTHTHTQHTHTQAIVKPTEAMAKIHTHIQVIVNLTNEAKAKRLTIEANTYNNTRHTQ